MKKEQTWYIVRHPHYKEYYGQFDIKMFGKHQTIEEARKTIDQENKRRLLNGEEALQYMITKLDWFLEKNSDGMFLETATRENFVELRDETDL